MTHGLYFEDFTPGRRFRSPGCTLTEAEIVSFGLTYDPQPFHIDKEAAKDTPFGGLIASGFQTLALGFRLFYQTGAIAACSLGGAGVDELRWTAPVCPGDTLRVEVEVVDQKASRSRSDRGRVRMAYALRNQRGETVATWTAHHILAKRDETIAV